MERAIKYYQGLSKLLTWRLRGGCQDLGIDDDFTSVHEARGIVQNSSNGEMHNSPHCPELVYFKLADSIGVYSCWLQLMDETWKP